MRTTRDQGRARESTIGLRKRPGFAAIRRALLATTALTLLAGLGAAPASAQAPEGRSFELVTPADKGNVGVLPFVRISDAGDGVAYQAFGAFAGGQAPARNQNTFVARRGPGGWENVAISPPSPLDPPSQYGSLHGNPFFAFNGDLSAGVLSNFAPTVPGGPEGTRNLLLRDNLHGSFSLITDRAPISGSPVEPNIAWTSSDLQHVLFDTPQGEDPWYAGGTYFPESPTPSRGSFFGAYHWSPGTGMSIASIRPDGSIAGSAEAGAGPQIPAKDEEEVYSDEYGGNRNSISEDGSRLFFTSPAGYGIAPTGQLYVRKDHGTPQAETIEVSAPEAGVTAEREPAWFRAATPDGSKVLFTSCGSLTPDSTASSDETAGFYCQAGDAYQGDGWLSNNNALYLYDVEAEQLVDLTASAAGGPRVRGVVGTSDDLTRIYFAAESVLAPGGVDSRPNLYLWDADAGFTHITVLNRGYLGGQPDLSDWANWLPRGHKLHDGRVSPDGRFVAFTSHREIDPTYEARDPETTHNHKQVYFWQIGDSEPRCVSCVGAGPATFDSGISNQRHGAGELYLPVYPDWEKRNLLADGRLYFETSNAIDPADRNDQIDVYEYDPSTESFTWMSRGPGATQANFAGATADGSAVFIRTPRALLPWDGDGAADIYVARTGTSDLASPPIPPTPCVVGPACAAPPTSGPPGPVENVSPGPRVRFAVRSLTKRQRSVFAKRGRVSVTVVAPGAGRLSVVGRAKVGARRRVVAKRVRRVQSAGRVRIPLRLTRPARKALRNKGKLRVRIQARVSGATRTISVLLERPTRKPANRKRR